MEVIAHQVPIGQEEDNILYGIDSRGVQALQLKNIEADANIMDRSKSLDKRNIGNCVAEWVDSKSDHSFS